MNHGGKRKGAGRKPRAIPLESITVKLEPELAEKFRSICKAKGRSQSAQFTEWVKRAKNEVPVWLSVVKPKAQTT